MSSPEFPNHTTFPKYPVGEETRRDQALVRLTRVEAAGQATGSPRALIPRPNEAGADAASWVGPVTRGSRRGQGCTGTSVTQSRLQSGQDSLTPGGRAPAPAAASALTARTQPLAAGPGGHGPLSRAPPGQAAALRPACGRRGGGEAAATRCRVLKLRDITPSLPSTRSGRRNLAVPGAPRQKDRLLPKAQTCRLGPHGAQRADFRGSLHSSGVRGSSSGQGTVRVLARGRTEGEARPLATLRAPGLLTATPPPRRSCRSLCTWVRPRCQRISRLCRKLFGS